MTYSNDTKGLRRIYDQVQTHVRGLCVLSVSTDSYLTMLRDIIIKVFHLKLWWISTDVLAPTKEDCLSVKWRLECASISTNFRS